MTSKRFQVGNRTVEQVPDAEVLFSESGRHVLRVGARIVSLQSASAADGAVWVGSRGATRVVRRVEPSGPRSAGGAVANGCVTPITPAVVVRVLVEPLDQVRQGQPVVVVSAMKMEVTLVAPRDGVVKAVRTAVGARVRPGDVLVEVSDEAEHGAG